MNYYYLRMVLLCGLFALPLNSVFSQATINVRVVSVAVLNNVDCDGIFTGDSDFVWEFIATDNTLAYSNNSPVLFGVMGDFNYAYQNGNNGPYTMVAPGGGFSPSNGLFFSHDYVCPTDVPTQININWRAYENDDVLNYSLLFGSDGETSAQNVSIPVPLMAGTNTQTFSASSTDGSCPQNYQVTFSVEHIPLVLNYLEDAICDAPQLNLNTTYSYGWCSTIGLEPNEPAASDVASNGSVWFRFVAPVNGEVEVSTDLSGTEFGTYFQLYHAADGSACNTGIHPLSAVVLKDKFEYLSNHEFSDGTDFLGIDPEAELILDACDPLAPFSYQKLIGGQTYYVQLTSDNANESGYYQVRVSDLGGSNPVNAEDIPCTAPAVAFSTTPISSAASSGPSINLDFECSYDGGNDFGETAAPHTSSDPTEYHAYDYDHVGANNDDVNESVWTTFTASNAGRIVFETDYQSSIYGESAALFGYDKQFAPGIPTDYHCANLENLAAADGGVNGVFGGGSESALIMQSCLEPGYTYYGMVDPSSSLTALSAQNIDVWIYDPSVDDPSNNPPGNDILCLTMLNTLYEVPVTPAGTTPQFQAVAGTNVKACTEFLAGEPPVTADPNDRADQTVWHYFTVPPSGAIEMNIRAYIGMDTLRYAVYELLNGSDCYGGLNPATFTEDGTKYTPVITSVLSGSAGFNGTQESICCMTPGSTFAIQLDGGSPGDEGQYIIEYIREVAAYAGDTYAELANGNQVSFASGDTAFVCYGDAMLPGNLLDGNGNPTLDIPSCLTPGFVLHSNTSIPDPVSGSGFTYIDTIQGLSGSFINSGNGSGTIGNPLFNSVYYLSSMADEPATWGDLSCLTATVDNLVPVVFLQDLNPSFTYDAFACEITFTADGGLSAFNGSSFSYEIENSAANLVETGTFSAGVPVVYAIPGIDTYTVTINDGACPYTFTVDASACSNPCIISPIIEFVNAEICNGDSLLLEGAYQTSPGLYTDVFTAANGCDSTIFTTLTIKEPIVFEQTATICQGTSFAAGGNNYSTSGVYIDSLIAANGCDSVVVTNLFVESVLYNSFSETICYGDNYNFNGQLLSSSGSYVDTLVATGGCDSVVTIFLTIAPEVTSSFMANICSGQSYSFGGQVFTSAGPHPVTFTNAAGCDSIVTLYLYVDAALEQTISHSICLGESYVLGTQTLTSSGIYTENFPTAGGCDSLVTLELSVIDCEAALLISNICTPNDDGKNDTWKVSDLSQIAGCTVQVFNRWGQLLYESGDYQNDWAGTKDGETLPDGTYYYTIGCGEEKSYQGVINLMRLKK